MLNIFSQLIIGVIVFCLFGCGDKSEKTSGNTPSHNQDVASKTASEAKKNDVKISLPKADKTIPLENYVEFNSAHQLKFAYLALASMPIDYAKIASGYSAEYASEGDIFKKNDLLAALKPKIDAEVAKIKPQRYIKILIDRPIDQQYDFERKGYSLKYAIGEPGSYRFFENAEYKLSYSNNFNFGYLNVGSEEAARKIESIRSDRSLKFLEAGQEMYLIIYCFIQNIDVSSNTINAEIVKVVLNDAKGNMLASQEASAP